jgi:hypothetical protein
LTGNARSDYGERMNGDDTLRLVPRPDRATDPLAPIAAALELARAVLTDAPTGLVVRALGIDGSGFAFATVQAGDRARTINLSDTGAALEALAELRR